jgi:hypothetical protein
MNRTTYIFSTYKNSMNHLLANCTYLSVLHPQTCSTHILQSLCLNFYVHAMYIVWQRGSYPWPCHRGIWNGAAALLILQLGTRQRWMVNSLPRLLLQQGKSPHRLLNRRLYVPHSWSGHIGGPNISYPGCKLNSSVVQLWGTSSHNTRPVQSISTVNTP